jgi:hypothetical protein
MLLANVQAWAKAPVLTDAQRIKQLQQQILLREPAERKEALERAAKAARKSRHSGARIRRGEGPGDLVLARRTNDLFAGAKLAALSAIQTPSNVLMNDTTGEDPGTCQSEISMAANGNNVLAAWNDGIPVNGTGINDYLGYAYSTDGGTTWTDGGAIPDAGIGTWASDPVVVVNEKTGEFYFSGLADQSASSSNSIAIVRGSFTGATFTWSTPVQIQKVSNSLALLDKEWIAVDSLSGNVYCSYSYFAGNSDEIRFQRSTNSGQTWSTPITMSSSADAGLVQGSRPAVGPSGEVYVTWHAIGESTNPLGIGPDHLRVRRSGNAGLSFAPETTPADLYSNFGSGGPGFNRGLGITFPGIAVDRSNGPHRGRVYVSWSEAVNFANDYYPQPGIDPAQSEIENNNGAAIATQFTPGAILRGTISAANPSDLDYFQWDATQGTTYVFWVDSLDTNLDASLRVFCSDAVVPSVAADNLAFSQNGTGGQDLIVFTAPTTAKYFLRIASYTQNHLGKYRIKTTVHNTSLPGRGRDQRDVFIASSDDGVNWSAPVRANDSPPYYDDFLPEVAVDGRGYVYVDCYDWRDSASICGGGSTAYLYESTDGGASFGAGVRLSDTVTEWSVVYSTLIPNQGDYIGLFARDSVVYTAWADGRGKGDPNAYMARVGALCAGAPVTLLSQTQYPDSLVLAWATSPNLAARVNRQQGSGAFVDLGPVVADGAGNLKFTDNTIVSGQTYTYRLQTTGFCQQYAGQVTVVITPPKGPDLTLLGVWPNPSTPDKGINVSFALDGTNRPVTISLLDISGREVQRVEMTGQGSHVVTLVQGIDVPPGLYFVRLSQGGVNRSKRVSIFP